MKTILMTLAFFATTSLFAQQAPVDLSQPEGQWLTAMNNEKAQAAMRLKGDSMLFVAYEQYGNDKVVVKIKGESGATLYRKSYRDQVKIARFDVSEFPAGTYKVNVILPGDTAVDYSFIKE